MYHYVVVSGEYADRDFDALFDNIHDAMDYCVAEQKRFDFFVPWRVIVYHIPSRAEIMRYYLEGPDDSGAAQWHVCFDRSAAFLDFQPSN